MEFSYDGYKRGMLIIPLIIVIICSIILFFDIIVTIKKFKTWNKIEHLKNILGYSILLFFLWAHIGNLKYGLPLLKEKENQSLVVEGKIEDIHKLKYAIRNSCLITISGAIKQNK